MALARSPAVEKGCQVCVSRKPGVYTNTWPAFLSRHENEPVVGHRYAQRILRVWTRPQLEIVVAIARGQKNGHASAARICHVNRAPTIQGNCLG